MGPARKTPPENRDRGPRRVNDPRSKAEVQYPSFTQVKVPVDSAVAQVPRPCRLFDPAWLQRLVFSTRRLYSPSLWQG